jgi:uroporphyrinogen decarboxylase
MNLFRQALERKNTGRPPVWFMRQAGRYHSHYQALRAKYSFMELCKKPEIACEVTLGPIRDFDFDAAILFSDLLFPLEVMGMGLTYEPGPKLGWHLRSTQDVARLRSGAALAQELGYQAEAMKLIRQELSPSKGLLGFVGGPLTLFCYAVEGSHAGGLPDSHEGIHDGRFEGFNDKLLELLAENMALQARAGADTVAVLDTCAGEFDAATYAKQVVPSLAVLLRKFHKRCPGFPVVYYSKGTGPEHWKSLKGLPIAGMGIDWHHDLAETLKNWTGERALQGNIDPGWLHLDPQELEKRLRDVFAKVLALDARHRQGWICGLGHGVLQKTPEQNVKLFLRIQKEMFGGSR